MKIPSLFVMTLLVGCVGVRGSSPQDAVTPHLQEEQAHVHAVIYHLSELGELLPPVDPDQRRAERRHLYQQTLCMLAYHLRLNGDPAFEPHVQGACAAQWRWWPDQAQYCGPCQK